MKIIILAGGEGARLWPISRRARPKQIKTFFGNQTLLEQTLARIRKGFSNNDIYISTLAKYFPAIRQKTKGIPKPNYIVEPVRRDRGPALGLAAAIIHARHPNVTIATAWADNLIPDTMSYIAALRTARQVVKKHPDFTVMLGIKPRYPATALGYIHKGKLLGKIRGFPFFLSEKFVEKPKSPVAEKLIKTGYVWNPGIFIWNTSHLLKLYKKYSPRNYWLLEKISARAKTDNLQRTINRIYPNLGAEEIENAILEKTKAKIVIPVDFTWADIGTYKTLIDILAKPGINLSYGLTSFSDAKDNFVYETKSGKLVAAIGLKNTVVVDTDDVLLVADKDSTDELKAFLQKLKKNQRLQKYL